MQAGKLKEQIIIQQATDSVSASGAISESWTTFATVRCEVMPAGSREYSAIEHKVGEHLARFKIRHLVGVTLKMRISWDSAIYDIKSIANTDNSDRELVIVGALYEN